MPLFIQKILSTVFSNNIIRSKYLVLSRDRCPLRFGNGINNQGDKLKTEPNPVGRQCVNSLIIHTKDICILNLSVNTKAVLTSWHKRRFAEESVPEWSRICRILVKASQSKMAFGAHHFLLVRLVNSLFCKRDASVLWFPVYLSFLLWLHLDICILFL